MDIDRVISRTGTGHPPELALLKIGLAIADFWAKKEAVYFLRIDHLRSIHFPELAVSFFTFGRDPARLAVVDFLTALRDSKIVAVDDLISRQLNSSVSSTSRCSLHAPLERVNCPRKIVAVM